MCLKEDSNLTESIHKNKSPLTIGNTKQTYGTDDSEKQMIYRTDISPGKNQRISKNLLCKIDGERGLRENINLKEEGK